MQASVQVRVFVACGMLALAACQRAPGPDAPSASAANAGAQTAQAAMQPAAPAEFGESMLWLDPLQNCGDKQVSRIHWSKEAVAKGAASVELGETAPGVFARIGSEGEKETGNWAYPGGVVVLRGVDGEIRARQIFKGPGGCTTTAASEAAMQDKAVTGEASGGNAEKH